MPATAGGSAAFRQTRYAPVRVHCHHAEAAGFTAGHFNTGDGTLGPVFHVFSQHLGIVHLVDVIAGQNHHVLGGGFVGRENIDVLIHGIRCSAIPEFFVNPLLGRQEVDKLVGFTAQETPAALQVAQRTLWDLYCASGRRRVECPN